jgi:hypothetical protein
MEKGCPVIPLARSRQVYGTNGTSPAAYSTKKERRTANPGKSANEIFGRVSVFSQVEVNVMKLTGASIRIDGKHEAFSLTPRYLYRRV